MRIFLGCLAAIVLIGGGLRFTRYAMPNVYPDEEITAEVVRHMRQSGDWDVNWRLAELSPDLKYDQYNFSSHLYATYFFYRVVKLVPGTLAWRSERDGFLVYRFLSALLASLVVVQAMRLGFAAAGRPAAIAGGFLTAISVLLVQDAHYVRPEPFMTVLTLAAVALSLPEARSTRWRPALAGLCLGLLIACKISMVMLLWVPFVPLVLSWRTAATWRTAGVIVLAAALGFFVGAPGALTHPDAFLNGVRRLNEQYHSIHPPHSHSDGRPMADLLAKYFIATLGWPVIATFVLGVVVLVRDRAWVRLTLLVGPVLIFFGGFATRSVFFERNLSPVVPLVFVVAGVGVAWLAGSLVARWRLPAGAGIAVLLVVLAFRPASLTWRLVTREYSGRRDQEQQAFEAELRAKHPGAEWQASALLFDFMPEDLEKHFQGGGREILLRATDYRDDWRAKNIKRFEDKFRAELLAERVGSFPEIPTGTLLTYHSTTERYYLVHGLR